MTALLLGALTWASVPAQAPAPLPNIIVILADDLGYGDLGSYGARTIETPYLDVMAAEGVRFTDFYAAAPVCSPSRAALLTGRYPIRTGITRVLKPRDSGGLPEAELTVAELLQSQGYRTGMAGKWHLGAGPPHLPLQHGFDEFFGLPYSNDMKPLRFMRGNGVLADDIPVDSLLTRRFVQWAADFIRRNADGPFFLYLAHSMPHYPIDASARWKGSSLAGLYGDVVQELDWSVGEVFRVLRETGLDDRTAVFFTSDNGSWKGNRNGPLRGEKASTWEGGIRVPLVARYPGVFQPAVVKAPAAGFDLFATVLQIAGAELPADRPIDGISLLPLLEGRDGQGTAERLNRRPLFFFHRETVQAVRRGRWKLHVGWNTWWDWLVRGPQPELYDLRADPGETEDLAPRRPDVVRQLSGLIASRGIGIPADHSD